MKLRVVLASLVALSASASSFAQSERDISVICGPQPGEYVQLYFSAQGNPSGTISYGLEVSEWTEHPDGRAQIRRGPEQTGVESIAKDRETMVARIEQQSVASQLVGKKTKVVLNKGKSATFAGRTYKPCSIH